MGTLRNLLNKLEEALNCTNGLIKENKKLKEQIEVIIAEKAEITAENEQLKVEIEEMKQEVVDQELVDQLNDMVDELVTLVKEAQ